MELDPVAVGLKFGFLAVLYLFLLWVARSALKDLRRGTRGGLRRSERGLRGRHRHVHARPLRSAATAARRSCAWRPGRACRPGSAYDLSDGALLGRGDQADIRSRTDSRPRGMRDSSRRGM